MKPSMKQSLQCQRFTLKFPRLSKAFNCCMLLGSYASYESCSHFCLLNSSKHSSPRAVRLEHEIGGDEISPLNAGVVRLPSSWKLRSFVSWGWNVSLLFPPQIMQKVHFCWGVILFNVHETPMKWPLRLALESPLCSNGLRCCNF